MRVVKLPDIVLGCISFRPILLAWHWNSMCDLDAHLISFVNINRNSLIALLSSEAEAAGQLANPATARL
jgi:hypothetical protein